MAESVRTRARGTLCLQDSLVTAGECSTSSSQRSYTGSERGESVSRSGPSLAPCGPGSLRWSLKQGRLEHEAEHPRESSQRCIATSLRRAQFALFWFRALQQRRSTRLQAENRPLPSPPLSKPPLERRTDRHFFNMGAAHCRPLASLLRAPWPARAFFSSARSREPVVSTSVLLFPSALPISTAAADRHAPLPAPDHPMRLRSQPVGFSDSG